MLNCCFFLNKNGIQAFANQWHDDDDDAIDWGKLGFHFYFF